MFEKTLALFVVLFVWFGFVFGQTNPNHVRVSGYTRKDGTYVQPYFRTAPNATNRDNFSTTGNINPYTGKPGWIEPDSRYSTFYYNTYTYPSASNKSRYVINSTEPPKYRDRTYVEDEYGKYSCYLIPKDKRTFNIYDMSDNLILYLVVNHRGDWRIFDSNLIYIKTIFVTTEK
ncbi:hypothetical protein [Spirosoma rhododendri]|uniref:Uncharacterized protein n=1 Tax=Spirosoma rhododendri TaxID=2728024 RepID=A0A7L5DUD1_9BACT|nr:hypothetical protein [Spirosoma rhododendri]QJD80208.1 hypothetical protein HH216_18645 [Spirosoma rhododendri]